MIFRGKRVALIGPAPIEEDARDIVQSCDIVVRLNHALPIPPEVSAKTTDRTDVLYVWRQVKPLKCWDAVGHIRMKTDALFADDFRDSPNFERYRAIKERVSVMDPLHFYGLAATLGCRPNTGLCAIDEIVADEPEYLYITGITFYRGGPAYHDGYVDQNLADRITSRRGNMGKHRQDPQVEYFRRHILPLPFVEVSETLDRVLVVC